jgi:hypothetical protein
MVTLKSLSAFGALPAIDLAKNEFKRPISQAIERVLPRMHVCLRLAGNLLFSSDDVVFGVYRFLAIKPFKPAHREVTARDLLEVLHERVVYGRTSERAHDRKGLSRHLLGDDNDAAQQTRFDPPA